MRVNRNLWLVTIFVAFSGSILAFAKVYYELYQNDASAFAVNADISAAQLVTWKDEASTRWAGQRRKAVQLFSLIKALDSGERPKVVKRSLTGPASLCELKTAEIHYVFISNPVMPLTVTLKATDVRTGITNEWNVGSIDPERPDDTLRMVLSALALRESMQVLGEGVTYGLANADPPIWTFWDFCYFSGITATTVGYGDILPNSTRVRMIVLTQVLFSSFLLVVAINISLQPLSS